MVEISLNLLSVCLLASMIFVGALLTFVLSAKRQLTTLESFLGFASISLPVLSLVAFTLAHISQTAPAADIPSPPAEAVPVKNPYQFNPHQPPDRLIFISLSKTSLLWRNKSLHLKPLPRLPLQ